MSVLENLKKKQKPGLKDYAHEALGSLPTAGAIAGGMIGGSAGAAAGGVGALPGAVGGASIGGAGGEALKQLGDRALGLGGPSTPAEALSNIQKQGMTQGAYELAGPAIGAASKGLGRGFMAAATKFTPEVAQTAIREGVTAGRKGYAKVVQTLGDLGAKTRALAAMHTASGVRFDPNADIVQGALAQVLPKIRNGADPAGDKAKVMEMAKTWLEGRVSPIPLGDATAEADGVYARSVNGKIHRVKASGGITPIELLESKQASDKIASPLWERGGKGQIQTDVDPLKQMWHQALANQMRTALHSIDAGIPGGLAELDSRASDLIKLKQALFPVAKKDQSFVARQFQRSLPVMGAGVAGGAAGALIPGSPEQRIEHGMIGAAVGAGISPGTISQLALALQGPQSGALRYLLKQTPRLAGLAFQPAASDR
jgi:hypothetical protein